MAQVSRPYFVAGGSPIWTPYYHDQLDRVIEADLPDGTVNKYFYDALTTKTELDVNIKNEWTTTVRNPEGLVASVTDANGGTTNYSYDAFGDPAIIQSPDKTAIQNQFDALGRKVQSSDPDMGTWTYQYDNLGELKQQISPTESATGGSTTLGYDVLGRLLWRSEPDMYSSWEYDLAPNGVGFVDSASCTQPAQQNGMTDACAGGSYVRTYGYESAASRPKSVTVQYGAAGLQIVGGL